MDDYRGTRASRYLQTSTTVAVVLPLLTILAVVGTGVSVADSERLLRSMYNVASSGSSQFDGTKWIRVSNMVCSNAVMFELYQDTEKSKKGIVLLHAGSKSITNIGNGKSLLIKLDGKTYAFESDDVLTEHEQIPVGHGVTMPFSHKTYVVPEAIVRKAALAEVLLTKVHLLNNTFIEGKCSPVTLQEAREQNKELGFNITQKGVDTSNKFAAINGFREFVRMMDRMSW